MSQNEVTCKGAENLHNGVVSRIKSRRKEDPESTPIRMDEDRPVIVQPRTGDIIEVMRKFFSTLG